MRIFLPVTVPQTNEDTAQRLETTGLMYMNTHTHTQTQGQYHEDAEVCHVITQTQSSVAVGF